MDPSKNRHEAALLAGFPCAYATIHMYSPSYKFATRFQNCKGRNYPALCRELYEKGWLFGAGPGDAERVSPKEALLIPVEARLRYCQTDTLCLKAPHTAHYVILPDMKDKLYPDEALRLVHGGWVESTPSGVAITLSFALSILDKGEQAFLVE